MLVATFGKMPRFFWFFLLLESSSSSPVPSPLPMLALLASPARVQISNSNQLIQLHSIAFSFHRIFPLQSINQCRKQGEREQRKNSNQIIKKTELPSVERSVKTNDKWHKSTEGNNRPSGFLNKTNNISHMWKTLGLFATCAHQDLLTKLTNQLLGSTNNK